MQNAIQIWQGCCVDRSMHFYKIYQIHEDAITTIWLSISDSVSLSLNSHKISFLNSSILYDNGLNEISTKLENIQCYWHKALQPFVHNSTIIIWFDLITCNIQISRWFITLYPHRACTLKSLLNLTSQPF